MCVYRDSHTYRLKGLVTWNSIGDDKFGYKERVVHWVWHRNKFPRTVIMALSLPELKKCLKSTDIWFEARSVPCDGARSMTMSLVSPFQLSIVYDSVWEFQKCKLYHSFLHFGEKRKKVLAWVMNFLSQFLFNSLLKQLLS